METTILLSKVIGIYVMLFGVIMMVRKEHFVPLISTFVRERLTRLFVSAIELLAGLFLIVIHTDFSSLPAGIISIFGWMMVIESLLYISAPDKTIQKLISKLNTPSFYLAGGLASLAIGLYLAGYGFGWF